MANETSCLEGFSVRAGRPRRESALTQAGVWPAPRGPRESHRGQGLPLFFPGREAPLPEPLSAWPAGFPRPPQGVAEDADTVCHTPLASKSHPHRLVVTEQRS